MSRHLEFRFDPSRGSDNFSDKLERLFGAARWVHNRAMIAQWSALKAGSTPPPLPDLITMCLDEPSKLPDTAWLGVVSRGVLIDEMEDLVGGWEDLRSINEEHRLPLKKKKDDQEIIFPKGTFNLTPVQGIGLGIDLEKVGQFATSHGSTLASADSIKIERSVHNIYTATVFVR